MVTYISAEFRCFFFQAFCFFKNDFRLLWKIAEKQNVWSPTSPLSEDIYIYTSHSLADQLGTTVDFTISFLHSSRFSAFCSIIFHSRPVHSLMMSSHHLLCQPLHLPAWTVPCRMVLASLDDRVMCLYHFSLHFFHWSQEFFIWPYGVSTCGFHFLISFMISVRDTEEFVETSHLYIYIYICIYIYIYI